MSQRWRLSFLGRAAALGCATWYPAALLDDEEEIVNWSGTHACRPRVVYAPESTSEAAAIVAKHHAERRPVRPCGSALSPNGLAFSEAGMLNMALCDRVLEVDAERRLVRAEAGARVEQVLEALAPHGLTLENLASIAAQQIGGFVQVGAHGTGATLPPVDEQVVAMRVATPARGIVELRPDDPDFAMCRVGLGACGVVLEATLRCVPKHLVRERVEVLSRQEAVARRDAIIRDNRHARYMWIPHVDAVVCVTNNPTLPPPLGDGQGCPPPPLERRLEPLRTLLYDLSGRDGDGLNFAELRDELLKLGPLDLAHVRRVNEAEAEFWRRSQGVDVADSSLKLNFECGGQQWVNECCFPTGTLAAPDGADLRFMLDLLAVIEAEGIPAPAPIEQRWTAASRSPMSPASSSDDQEVFSWVGIIMYLSDDHTRGEVTAAFDEYKQRCEDLLWPRYGAVEHWAKIELPRDEAHAARVRARLAARFPTHAFAAARARLDPHSILTNPLLDAVMPPPAQSSSS